MRSMFRTKQQCDSVFVHPCYFLPWKVLVYSLLRKAHNYAQLDFIVHRNDMTAVGAMMLNVLERVHTKRDTAEQNKGAKNARNPSECASFSSCNRETLRSTIWTLNLHWCFRYHRLYDNCLLIVTGSHRESSTRLRQSVTRMIRPVVIF